MCCIYFFAYFLFNNQIALPSISAPAYVQFAQNCAINFDPDRKVLEFPEGYIDMDNIVKSQKKKIFIRSCYAPLYEESLRLSNINNPTSDPVSIFILGTPGCGKSLFRMYFCHRLLDMAKTQTKDVYILFQKAKNNIFVVKKKFFDENATTLTYELVGDLLLRANIYQWEQDGCIVVSLIDVSNGIYDVGITAKYQYYFSSPNDVLIADKDRLKSGSRIDVYMGLWSIGESKMANEVLQLDISDSIIEERFYKFGGSARAILDKPELSETFLKKALTSLKNSKSLIRLLSMPEEDLASGFSHSLFHITSTDKNFTTAKYQWASLPIKQMVAEIALKQLTHELEGIMNSSYIAPGTKGEMIEALWFERFILATKSDSKENKMDVKEFSIPPLLSLTVSEMHYCLTHFTHITLHWCSTDLMSDYLLKALVDIRLTDAHSAILLRPHEFMMMAIDGIIITRLVDKICVFYLQATIAKNHSTSVRAAAYLDSLTENCSVDIFQALVFIIPKHRFEGWSRQAVLGRGISTSLPQYAILPGARLSGSEKPSKKRSAEEPADSSGRRSITRLSVKKG